MTIFSSIEYSEILNSIPCYYFGWTEEEIVAYKQQLHSNFYGHLEDARFEIIDVQGKIYYAIFRSPAQNELVFKKTKDYLLFKDQNRVLLNVGGKFYHFSINEKKVLDISYATIIGNTFTSVKSHYFHPLASPVNEIMIIVDHEGVAAINWDQVIWKHKFAEAQSGYIELKTIDDNQVTAELYAYMEGENYSLVFDIQTGKYIQKLISQ